MGYTPVILTWTDTNVGDDVRNISSYELGICFEWEKVESRELRRNMAYKRIECN